MRTIEEEERKLELAGLLSYVRNPSGKRLGSVFRIIGTFQVGPHLLQRDIWDRSEN
jgi:hypothetical protein